IAAAIGEAAQLDENPHPLGLPAPTNVLECLEAVKKLRILLAAELQLLLCLHGDIGVEQALELRRGHAAAPIVHSPAPLRLLTWRVLRRETNSRGEAGGNEQRANDRPSPQVVHSESTTHLTAPGPSSADDGLRRSLPPTARSM